MSGLTDPFGAFLPYPKALVPHASTGPLRGQRLAVKDLFDVAGYPTGAGNPFLLAASAIKTETAPVVDRLLGKGAAFVGKSQTDELAYSLLGMNKHFGTPCNPRRSDIIPGGSSSGSAVAVAAGLADIGLGTDTSGSIRLPAAANSLFGWRASHGLLPLTGCRPLAPSFDTVGIATRSLDIMALVMDALGLPRGDGAHRTLLIPQDLLDLCDVPIKAAFQNALEASGIAYTSIESAAGFDPDIAASAFMTILHHEAFVTNKVLLNTPGTCLDPSIVERLDKGRSISSEQLDDARSLRSAISENVRRNLRDNALLCLPTLPMLPPRIDAPDHALAEFRARSIKLLCLAGLSGCPQLTMPIGGSDSLIGMSIIASRNHDFDLITAGRAILPMSIIVASYPSLEREVLT